MKTKNGFTLVELIVVIVIIGILALISVIGYSNQARRARNNSVFSSLSETVKAVSVCAANADTVAAYTAGGAICTSAGTAAVSGLWPDLVNGFGGGWNYTPSTGPTYNSVTNVLTMNAQLTENGSVTATINCTINGCTKSSGF